VADLPLLEQDFYNTYNSKGLEIVAVCLDDDKGRIISTISQFNLSYHVLVDNGMAAAKAYKANAIPLNLIIDRKGVIQYREVGYNPDAMKEIIEKSL